jgi:hypothetical protein
VELPVEQLADVVAFCDPAGGKQSIKRTRARTAIVVIGQDWLQRVYVLHTWAERASTDRIIENIFRINTMWRPKIFGIEENGLASLFGGSLRREARFSNMKLNLVGVAQSSKVDKFFRNRSILQPLFAQGRLFMQESQVELRAELESHPMGQTVDLVDALSSGCSLLPKRAAPAIRSAERDALGRYLRASGASPWYIEKRLKEWTARHGNQHAAGQQRSN